MVKRGDIDKMSVVPAGAGVIPVLSSSLAASAGGPRRCGGDPSFL